MRGSATTIALLFIVLHTECVFSQDESARKAAESASIDAIASKLEGVARKLKSISVSCRAVDNLRFFEPGVEPPETAKIEDSAVASRHVSDAVWALHGDGSGRYEALINVTNISFDGSTIGKQRRFISVFDARRGRGKYVIAALAADGGWAGTEVTESRFVRGLDEPIEFITQFMPDRPFSVAILDDLAQVVRTESWRGEKLLVLESRKYTLCPARSEGAFTAVRELAGSERTKLSDEARKAIAQWLANSSGDDSDPED